jgi:hypothetical protein
MLATLRGEYVSHLRDLKGRRRTCQFRGSLGSLEGVGMRMISLVSWCRSCRLPKLLDWMPSGRRVVVFAAMLTPMISEKGTWGRDDMPYVKLAVAGYLSMNR